MAEYSQSVVPPTTLEKWMSGFAWSPESALSVTPDPKSGESESDEQHDSYSLLPRGHKYPLIYQSIEQSMSPLSQQSQPSFAPPQQHKPLNLPIVNHISPEEMTSFLRAREAADPKAYNTDDTISDVPSTAISKNKYRAPHAFYTPIPPALYTITAPVSVFEPLKVKVVDPDRPPKDTETYSGIEVDAIQELMRIQAQNQREREMEAAEALLMLAGVIPALHEHPHSKPSSSASHHASILSKSSTPGKRADACINHKRSISPSSRTHIKTHQNDKNMGIGIGMTTPPYTPSPRRRFGTGSSSATTYRSKLASPPLQLKELSDSLTSCDTESDVSEASDGDGDEAWTAGEEMSSISWREGERVCEGLRDGRDGVREGRRRVDAKHR